MWKLALINLYLAPLEFLTINAITILLNFRSFGAFTQAYTRTLGNLLIKLTRFLEIFYFLYVKNSLFFKYYFIFYLYIIYIILTIIIDKEELSFEVYLIITFIIFCFYLLHDTILRRYFEGELIYIKTFDSYIIIGILFGITYLSSRKKKLKVSTILSVLIFTIKKILLFEKIESKANEMKERLKNKG